MKNAYFMELHGAKQAFAPVDLNTAAITGARIGMKNGDRLAIVLSFGASVAATVQVTLRQHDAAVGGTSKDLVVANKYYHKAGAAEVFTQVEPTVAAALVDASAIFAADAGILVLEVLAEDLDVNGEFSHVSIDVADSGAAKVGAALYIVNADFKPAYEVAL